MLQLVVSLGLVITTFKNFKLMMFECFSSVVVGKLPKPQQHLNYVETGLRFWKSIRMFIW
jgi:hypothetical protein